MRNSEVKFEFTELGKIINIPLFDIDGLHRIVYDDVEPIQKIILGKYNLSYVIIAELSRFDYELEVYKEETLVHSILSLPQEAIGDITFHFIAPHNVFQVNIGNVTVYFKHHYEAELVLNELIKYRDVHGDFVSHIEEGITKITKLLFDGIK